MSRIQICLIEHVALKIDALQIENVCCGEIVVAARCAFANVLTPAIYVFEATKIVDATERQQQAYSPAPKCLGYMLCSATRSSANIGHLSGRLPDQIAARFSAHDIDWTISRVFHKLLQYVCQQFQREGHA